MHYHTIGPPIVSVCHSTYFTDAEKRAKVPFLYHELVETTCDGLEYTIMDHDITIRIPKGAVAIGKKVHLEIAVAMFGPFYFPENTRPISPILWLCLLEEDIKLKKPFEIIFSHFLAGLTKEKALCHEVGFAKANHNDLTLSDAQISYHFLPSEVDFRFASSGSNGYGILQANHCCFYCIKAKKTPQLTLDASYCLVRIESAPLLRTEVYFVAVFLFSTCLQVRLALHFFVVDKLLRLCHRRWTNNFQMKKGTNELMLNLDLKRWPMKLNHTSKLSLLNMISAL